MPDPDSRPELSIDEWSHLKAQWFALEGAAASEQHRVLAAATPAVRARLERMLAAAEQVGSRFDTPAALALGSAPMARAVDAEAPTSGLIGQRIGAFRVIRMVGHGGMGAVYEAERDDREYRQRVAIKTLWRGADSDVLLRRFRSERQILAGLQHPHIAQLVDGGATESGTPWLAMEFVDGVPIDEYCDTHRLPIAARLDLFRHVCHAVHHAHQRLVIHRDLKPSNILVTADGTVKLLDFGVAKLLDDAELGGTLTGAGISPFTAGYAAPEQAGNDGTSTATDVFALGAVMVTLLAGAPPLNVTGLDPVSRILAVRDDAPRLPSVVAQQASNAAARVRGFDSPRALSAALRGELDAIAGRALQREPARRYAGAQSLGDDIRRYLRRDRVLAQPDTATYRLWTFVRRNRTLAFGTLTVLAAILVVSVLSLQQARELRDEAARTERAAAFLAGIVTGTSSVSQDPIFRMGPRGTMEELLDSALTRVPREFPDDARVRARLYTAIGANFATQSRYRQAHQVLDSARILAREAYGREGAEHVSANLEMASLQLAFRGPDAADESLEAALSSTRVRDVSSTLRTRGLLLRAQQDYLRGRIVRADSLARLVRDLERASRGPTSVVAKAEALLLTTSSWLLRDPRDYLRRGRALSALTDSLGMQLSTERDAAARAEIEALLVLGRADSAAAKLAENITRLEAAFGDNPVVQSTAKLTAALLASVRGDSARRRVLVEESRTALTEAPDAPLSELLLVSNAWIDDALARQAYADAARMADSTRDVLRRTPSALVLVFADLYVGLTRLAIEDAVGAEAALRSGLATVAAAPDLSSMGPRLRRPLADALRAQGRLAESDSVRRLDRPRSAVPRCTPGGEWLGCPDR